MMELVRLKPPLELTGAVHGQVLNRRRMALYKCRRDRVMRKALGARVSQAERTLLEALMMFLIVGRHVQSSTGLTVRTAEV